MGPRSAERGSIRERSAVRKRLQWGHVRLNVEVISLARVPRMLQWGHVRLNVEVMLPLEATISGKASMGPRSAERGSSTTGSEQWPGDASMGPRSAERGSVCQTY